MVYCGKPAQGCERCRARRLKCDLGRPGCQKCVRAQCVCPGYRQLQDLMFRNETSKTVRKHERSESYGVLEQRNAEYVAPTDRDAIRLCLRRQTVSRDDIDYQVLNMALAFFYTQQLKGSNFDWVPSLHGNLPTSCMFGSVVHATALAAYANHQNHPQSLQSARKLYNRCLLQLHAAIGSGTPADDDMLASVLLMSSFENLAGDGDEVTIANAWASHAYGAFTLLDSYHRHRPQSDHISTVLVTQTVQNYNLYRFHTRRSNPSLKSKIESPQPGVSGAQSRDKLIDLKKRAQSIVDVFWEFEGSPRLRGASGSLKDVLKARQIDDQVVALLQEMAVTVPFQSPVNEDRGTFTNDLLQASNSFGAVYRNHHEARLWNSLRMVRLSLHDRAISSAVLASLAKDSATVDRDTLALDGILEMVRQKSSRVIEEVSADICRSALYFLREDQPQCTYTAASYLLWPLFVVGRVCHERSDFVRAQLRKIGDLFKIKSALLAANNLNNEEYRDDWLYASYLS